MSQANKILKALKEGKRITAFYALIHFDCFRLAARINDLRGLGYGIKTTNKISNGKCIAEYTMDCK